MNESWENPENSNNTPTPDDQKEKAYREDAEPRGTASPDSGEGTYSYTASDIPPEMRRETVTPDIRCPSDGFEQDFRPQPPKKPQRPKAHINGWAIACFVLAAIVGIGGAFTAGYLVSGGNTPVIVAPADAGQTDEVQRQDAVFYHAETVPAEIAENTVAAVNAKVASSVVEITTESVQTGNYFMQYVSSGAGSGVILSNNGYIVTNNHVVSGADTIMVRLNNGAEYQAEVIGADSESDIALLKIDAEGLNAAVIGDSDNLTVGEQVVAIGNPLGKLGGTVTDGIISACSREVTVSGETRTLLQTNAAVNPGNSGGGLFNMRGELIGIVNAKSAGSDVEGLGFAIPVNTADSVLQQLLDYGYVRGRIDLGLSYLEINSSTMAYYYRVNSLGLYITDSTRNDKLKNGDRVLTFNGSEITSLADLKAALKECSVGDTAEMVVIRNGKTVEVDVECFEETPQPASVSIRDN